MYGLPPGGFAGTRQHWESLVHPEDRLDTMRRVEQAAETGKFEAEWRVSRPDGTLRWLAGRGSVFKDEAGKPLRLIGVNIEITQAKRVEAALRRTQSDLRDAQRVPSAQLVLDRRTGAVTGSEELYHILGLDPGMPFPDLRYQEPLYTPESWHRLKSARQAALETGAGYEMDLELARADGAGTWVATHGEAVRDAVGKIAAFIARFRRQPPQTRGRRICLQCRAPCHQPGLWRSHLLRHRRGAGGSLSLDRQRSHREPVRLHRRAGPPVA
jgi:PAS domain-containing protein